MERTSEGIILLDLHFGGFVGWCWVFGGVGVVDDRMRVLERRLHFERADRR